VLEEMRARTGLLLAASSLAASLFGRAAFADLHPVAIAVIALVAFLISLGASLSVLMPRSSFVFSLGGTTVYQGLYEFGDDIDEVHRRLTYDLQRFWDDNDTRIKPLINSFRVAAIALGVEVLALALLVSGRIG
jgi:hypothetical protein